MSRGIDGALMKGNSLESCFWKVGFQMGSIEPQFREPVLLGDSTFLVISLHIFSFTLQLRTFLHHLMEDIAQYSWIFLLNYHHHHHKEKTINSCVQKYICFQNTSVKPGQQLPLSSQQLSPKLVPLISS